MQNMRFIYNLSNEIRCQKKPVSCSTGSPDLPGRAALPHALAKSLFLQSDLIKSSYIQYVYDLHTNAVNLCL